MFYSVNTEFYISKWQHIGLVIWAFALSFTRFFFFLFFVCLLRAAFNETCQSLTTVISYWNPCIWLAESKICQWKTLTKHLMKCPQGSVSWNLSVTDNCYKLLKSLHLIGWEQNLSVKNTDKTLDEMPPWMYSKLDNNQTTKTTLFFLLEKNTVENLMK